MVLVLEFSLKKNQNIINSAELQAIEYSLDHLDIKDNIIICVDCESCIKCIEKAPIYSEKDWQSTKYAHILKRIHYKIYTYL